MAKQRRQFERVGDVFGDHSGAGFLLAGVRVFLKSPDLSEMTIQNDCGAIVVKRRLPEKGSVQAIGFGACLDGEDEDDAADDEDEGGEGYENFVESFVRWF